MQLVSAYLVGLHLPCDVVALARIYDWRTHFVLQGVKRRLL